MKKEITEQNMPVKHDDDPILQYLEKHADNPFEHHGVELYFETQCMEEIMEEQNKTILLFTTHSHYNLTQAQRNALIGTGIRNLGFLEKSFQLAQEFEALRPIRFSIEELTNIIGDINFCRNLQTRIREFDRIITDSLLVYGDNAFRLALRFYRSVRELARQGDQDAIAVFNQLRPFFRRPRPADMPPTEPEVLRDAKALLHGKKEGEIVIEAHAKHTTPAEKTIVDNTNMPHHATFKETELGEFCDNCGCENHEHHKFCHGCGKQLV